MRKTGRIRPCMASQKPVSQVMNSNTDNITTTISGPVRGGRLKLKAIFSSREKICMSSDCRRWKREYSVFFSG